MPSNICLLQIISSGRCAQVYGDASVRSEGLQGGEDKGRPDRGRGLLPQRSWKSGTILH